MGSKKHRARASSPATPTPSLKTSPSKGVPWLAVTVAVAAVAARPVLANIFAGLQIAITQPMRIDDVVIVEGEWGWIEEITATYVVVRIWDWRRLVLPISYFIEKPFENWTRESGAIIGSVVRGTQVIVPRGEDRIEAGDRLLVCATGSAVDAIRGVFTL